VTEQATIEIQKRTVTGKAVRQLRAIGLVPANIFGGDRPSEAIQVRSHDLERAFKARGAASIFQLALRGRSAGGPCSARPTRASQWVHPTYRLPAC
jgi:ribosomal protein L25 (general stress protein Ctc)